jgi:hypothetical protein
LLGALAGMVLPEGELGTEINIFVCALFGFGIGAMIGFIVSGGLAARAGIPPSEPEYRVDQEEGRPGRPGI